MKTVSQKKVEEIFAHLDIDGSGTLEEDEVKNAFSCFCEDEDQAKLVAKEFIKNYGGKDKKIDIEEFKKWLADEGVTVVDE